MQLSIQASAEHRAGELIKAWGKRSGIGIADVRYHLLRNGLILQDIHLQLGSDRIRIAQMLLRANPKRLTGTAPKIGNVQVFGLEAELSPEINMNHWLQQRALLQLWHAVSKVDVADGRVSLRLRDNAPALGLHNVEFHQQRTSLMRSMSGSAELQQGHVAWHWNVSDRSKDPYSHGQMAWQALDAATLLTAWQLAPVKGRVSGDLVWDSEIASALTQNTKDQPLNLTGSIHLDRSLNDQQMSSHDLSFHANQRDGIWQAGIQAVDWPLQPWRDSIPAIGEHRFVAGQLAGQLHLQGEPGRWKISSSKGLLQDVIFALPDSMAEPEGLDAAAWYWSSIDYSAAKLDMAHRQLHFSRLRMQDSRLAFLAMQPADSHQPASLAASPSAWRLAADQIDVRNMMLALQLPRGRVMVDALNGRAHSTTTTPLHFKLATTAKQEVSAGSTPTADTKASWRLQGSVEQSSDKKQPGADRFTARMEVRGKHIALSDLRALLPLQGRDDWGVDLSGTSDFKLAVSVQQDHWRMSGDTTIQDIRLAQGGDTWKAERVSMHFGPLGMGLDQQLIPKLNVSEWQYTAAMQPLALHPAEISSPSDQERRPWWMSALQQHQLVIGQFQAADGALSIGQPQSRWVDHLHVTASNIRAGHWSPLEISGEIGGGNLNINGKWNPLAEGQRFLGKANMADAKPFFLNDWLSASGMPRLLRGRLSLAMAVDADASSDTYQGNMEIELLQGQMEPGNYLADPLLPRTGYKTLELLQRLEVQSGRIDMKVPLQGNWIGEPLNIDSLGDMLLVQMKQQAISGNWRAEAEDGQTSGSIMARVRLHKRSRLSLNERNRVLHVMKKMRADPKMMLELRPRWTGAALTADVLGRIDYTQRLIERYLGYWHIEKRRVFPVWPSASDHADEIGAIEVIAIPVAQQEASTP